MSLILATAVATGVIALWKGKPPTIAGSARWLKFQEAARFGAFEPGGVPLGDWDRQTMLPVVYNGGSNLLTVGPPRSGKGAGVLVPSALQATNMVLVDPGGEITATCIGEWRNRGLKVHVVNPWAMFSEEPWKLPKSGFNPVSILDPKSPSFDSDAKFLAEMLVVERGSDPNMSFFTNKARSWIKGLLMLIAATAPPEERTLSALRSCIMADQKGMLDLIEAMKGSEIASLRDQGNEWARMMSIGPRQFDAVMSTMEEATSFLTDPLIQETLQRNDCRFEDVKGLDVNGKPLTGAVIAIVVPLDHLQSQTQIMRLFVGQALMLLARAPIALLPVHFLIDEFPALGKMPRVVDGLATLGRYRVRLHLTCQTLGQLLQLYGQGWTAIEGSCEVRQYIGAWDLFTSEHLSKMIGKKTVETITKMQNGVSRSFIGRLLMMDNEVRTLSKDMQVVFLGNSHPALMKITPYWQRPGMRGAALPNPYHGATPPLRLGWQMRWIRGQVLIHVAKPYRLLRRRF